MIYGPDLGTLAQLGETGASALRRVPGAVGVRIEQVAGLRCLRIVPDRARLARSGLAIEGINQFTETIALDHKVGAVLEGERRFGRVIKTRWRRDFATGCWSTTSSRAT